MSGQNHLENSIKQMWSSSDLSAVSSDSPVDLLYQTIVFWG